MGNVVNGFPGVLEFNLNASSYKDLSVARVSYIHNTALFLHEDKRETDRAIRDCAAVSGQLSV